MPQSLFEIENTIIASHGFPPALSYLRQVPESKHNEKDIVQTVSKSAAQASSSITEAPVFKERLM